MNMTNNLDISSISNKSKNSVKDFFENRSTLSYITKIILH